MTFTENGILLLQELHLFSSQLDGFLAKLLFQLQPAVVAAAHLVAVEDLLNGGRTDADTIQLEPVTQAITAPGGMGQAQGQNPFFYLRWCGLGMGMVDRQQIFQAGQPMGLEAAFVFIKLRAGNIPATTGFRDIAQGFGQFQHTQTLIGDFFLGFHAHNSFLQFRFWL